MLLVLEQMREGHDGSCAVLGKYEGSYDRKDDKEGVWLDLVLQCAEDFGVEEAVN